MVSTGSDQFSGAVRRSLTGSGSTGPKGRGGPNHGGGGLVRTYQTAQAPRANMHTATLARPRRGPNLLDIERTPAAPRSGGGTVGRAQDRLYSAREADATTSRPLC